MMDTEKSYNSSREIRRKLEFKAVKNYLDGSTGQIGTSFTSTAQAMKSLNPTGPGDYNLHNAYKSIQKHISQPRILPRAASNFVKSSKNVPGPGKYNVSKRSFTHGYLSAVPHKDFTYICPAKATSYTPAPNPFISKKILPSIYVKLNSQNSNNIRVGPQSYQKKNTKIMNTAPKYTIQHVYAAPTTSKSPGAAQYTVKDDFTTKKTSKQSFPKFKECQDTKMPLPGAGSYETFQKQPKPVTFGQRCFGNHL